MIVHTNIEKYTIFYTIRPGPQICTINKRLVNAILESFSLNTVLLTLFWTGGGGKFAPPAGFLNIAQKPLSLGS